MKQLWLVLITALLATGCNNATDTPPAGEGTSTSNAEKPDGDTKPQPIVVADDDSANETNAAEPVTPEWAKDVDLASVGIADEMDRIKKLMTEEREAFIETYNKASKEEKLALREEFPGPEAYITHANALIKAQPESPQLSAAYAFLVARSFGPESDAALETLFEKYADSVDMKDVCFMLAYAKSNEETEKRIESLINSPHEEVRGIATYTKAQYLNGLEEQAKMIEEHPEYAERMGDVEYLKNREVDQEEIVALYKTVVEKFSSCEFMDQPIGPMAEGALFEMEHLSVGKTAPDIEGEDIEGVSFSLADYRGKVVMLDFWGDW